MAEQLVGVGWIRKEHSGARGYWMEGYGYDLRGGGVGGGEYSGP